MISFFKVFLIALLVVFKTTYGFSASVGDDGLHKQDWFSITFRDVKEDIESAHEQGKRLVMIFEQRGCIYCKEMHENVLSDPDVSTYIQKNFVVVQYNIYGDEEVIDMDGEILTEKTVSRKWGLLFTPTIMFMPENSMDEKNAKNAAVAVMPGSFKKGTFLDMFTWVRQKGYDSDEGFQAYHARSISERRASGLVNTD